MNAEKQYKRWLEKMSYHYEISQRSVQVALYQLYKAFILRQELEPFLAELKEKQLNMRKQQ